MITATTLLTFFFHSSMYTGYTQIYKDRVLPLLSLWLLSKIHRIFSPTRKGNWRWHKGEFIKLVFWIVVIKQILEGLLGSKQLHKILITEKLVHEADLKIFPLNGYTLSHIISKAQWSFQSKKQKSLFSWTTHVW